MKAAIPWLSVIIPVQGPAGDIAGCLQSLAACREPGLEVILVDDGLKNANLVNAHALAKEMLLPFKAISQPGASPGAARNLGAIQARGEVLFFTLPGCQIPVRLPSRLKELFSETSLSAAGGGLRPLEPASPLAKLIALEMSFIQGGPEKELQTCPHMYCAAFRAAAFKAAGMCNQSLVHADGMDRKLCQGVLAQGGTIRQDPELWVTQDLPQTWGQVWQSQISRGENRFHELRGGLRLSGEAYLQPVLLLLALGLLVVLGLQDPARALSLALICVLLLYPANRAFLKYVGEEEPGLLKTAFPLCLLRPAAWVAGMLKAALVRLGFKN